MMKMIHSFAAIASFMLITGLASAATTSVQSAPDGPEVIVVQNGGTMNFTGPVNVTHEKAIGSKITFSLEEGKKRSIYVSRGDKVTTQVVRIAMPPPKKRN